VSEAQPLDNEKIKGIELRLRIYRTLCLSDRPKQSELVPQSGGNTGNCDEIWHVCKVDDE
jgi:hypothetical protein